MNGEPDTVSEGTDTAREIRDAIASFRAEIEACLARQAAREAVRAEFARRRAYGLRQRHAAKLARNRQE